MVHYFHPAVNRPTPVSSDTYVLWLVVVPDPIWPQLFWPQEKMSPSCVKQRLWWLPHATATTFLPSRLFWIRAGVRPWRQDVNYIFVSTWSLIVTALLNLLHIPQIPQKKVRY